MNVDPTRPGWFLEPDYYDVLARLRAHAGFLEFAPGMKAVARYDDIREISRRPDDFCSGRGVLVNDPLRDGYAVEGSILHMDPPEHGEWRRILNRQFTGRAVSGMEDGIRALAVELIERMPRHEVVEFVDAVAAPLPVWVIAELLGVPESDRGDFRRWSDSTIAATDGRGNLSDDDARNVTDLVSFLDAHAQRLAADPGDDVVSLLVQSEVNGRKLTAGELVTFAMSLLVAGNETTRHLLSGAMATFADHLDQWERLRSDPTAAPGAVEEMLRFVTPIQQFARTAVADTDVNGVPVREGDYLVMLYASGNRDEAAFGPTAGRFDAFRPVAVPNLAFGFGEHLCLGAALARAEARIVMEELTARFASFEIAGEPQYLPSSLVRGPCSVPVRFE